MNDLPAIAQRLGLDEFAEALQPQWDEAMAAMPAGVPDFLELSFVREMCAFAELIPAMSAGVVCAARRVATDEALRALMWYCHYRLFVSTGPAPKTRAWPLPTAALDRDAGNFYVVLLLSGTPCMRAIHRRRAIPADIVRATVLDLKLNLETEDYTEDYGHYGISLRILGWLLLHWRGELYRLGRLQFLPTPMHGKLRAFRHVATGRIAALADDGLGDMLATPLALSPCRETDEAYVGAPVDPLGQIAPEERSLAKAEWRPVLAPGDPMLDMHIAAGEPMDFDACGQSIRRALDFFPRHFPDKPFLGFTCYSWILDPQFEPILPATSNLVRFQRELYLFPIRSSDGSTLNTVFGRHRGEFATWPRRTAMQRAFAAFMERGGRFRAGGAFLLKEDFNWGSAVYRRPITRS